VLRPSRVKDKSQHDESRDRERAGSMNERLALLLVEDNPADADFVVEALRDERAQVSVTSVDRIDAALRAIAKEKFSLVLLDLALPDSASFNLGGLQQLHAAAPDLAIVVHTSAPDEMLGINAVAAGAQDYLAKGDVTGSVLLRTMRYAIERQQLVTRARQLVEQAELARRDAEEANRAKDQFLAMVSHELRTPLTSILGWAAILAKHPADGARLRKGLGIIERNAQQQAQLVNDLLDVSRIVTGKLTLSLEAVDPVLAIETAVETVRVSAEANDINIVSLVDVGAANADRDETAPVNALRADPDRLQQILWNLLVNAVKFTPRGGTVRVRLARTPTSLSIAVADTGIGIATDFLPHVFQRFRQADSSTTRAHGGLGIGLSIVRHLVEAHGGTVRAESPGVDAGATFTVSLPLVEASAHATRKAPAADADAAPTTGDPRDGDGGALRGVCVLLVEDDRDTAEVMVIALEALHARVLVAHSCEDALKLLDVERPDVLICDIGLPHKDGYQMIRELRDRPHDRCGEIAAVALTAFGRAEDRQRAMRAGFDSHCAKPAQLHDLAGMVAAARAGAAIRQGRRQAVT
jgi:signal transduction histidine kinase